MDETIDFLRESLKNPMINIAFLALMTEKDHSGMFRKLIEICLDHKMPFGEVGGFINDIVAMMEEAKRENKNDPEQALLNFLLNQQNTDNESKE